MHKKHSFTWTMIFLIVGTSVGAGILALPIETGSVGFLPSFSCLILIWILMATTGWIFIYKFMTSIKKVSDFAGLYENELGGWAKYINTIAYLITFYGLLVAYLAGASTTIIKLFPGLEEVSYASPLLIIILFIAGTSVVLFGMEMVRKSNALLTILLFIFFFIMIVLVVDHLNPNYLYYTNWYKAPLEMPILVTAFGFHILIPIMYNHSKKQKIPPKMLFKVLIIGTLIVFLVNTIWATIVMGILPLTSPINQISITGALRSNVPATVPLANLIQSDYLIAVALSFTLFAIATSYLGVGSGFMNYIKDLTGKYFKRNRVTDALITFTLPLIVVLIDPNLFIKTLNLVGGIGVTTSYGILPGLLALKSKHPLYIRIMGVFALTLSIFIFCTECIILLK